MTALRYPFSLFTETKRAVGDCTVQRTGDVADTMDKGIGRPVIKIKGAVSANNHIDFEGLNLTGQFVYIQLKLLSPSIATFHLEIVTTADVSLRLTVSTLYAGDRARFLGRSLRLPLPVHQGWMLVVLDMNRIVENFCVSGGGSGRHPPSTLKAIKRVQLCSNMLVRDVVTSNKRFPLGIKFLPRELAIISQTEGDDALAVVDVAEMAAGDLLPGNAGVRSPSASPVGMRRKAKAARLSQGEGDGDDGLTEGENEEDEFEPAPLPSFGSHLSAAAAASMRYAVLEADTNTPMAHKLLGLLQPVGSDLLPISSAPNDADAVAEGGVDVIKAAEKGVGRQQQPQQQQHVVVPKEPSEVTTKTVGGGIARQTTLTTPGSASRGKPAVALAKAAGGKSGGGTTKQPVVSAVAEKSTSSSSSASATTTATKKKPTILSSSPSASSKGKGRATVPATVETPAGGGMAIAADESTDATPNATATTTFDIGYDEQKEEAATATASIIDQTLKRPGTAPVAAGRGGVAATATAQRQQRSPPPARPASAAARPRASSPPNGSSRVTPAGAPPQHPREAAASPPPKSRGLQRGQSAVTVAAAAAVPTAVFRGSVSSRLLALTGSSGRARTPPQRLAATQTGAVVRPAIPPTKPSERVLAIERVLSYSGGPALLLYEGKLVMNTCGNLIVLIDVEGSAATADLDNPGFWKAFKSYAEVEERRRRQRDKGKGGGLDVQDDDFSPMATGSGSNVSDVDGAGSFSKTKGGCEQSFLRGHTAPIGILEMSPDGALIASAETCAKGNVFLWGVADGRRFVTLKPHSDSISAVAFSEDNSLLVTAGTDQQRRVQIIVWNVQSLTNQTPQLSIVARQLSEFPISRIRFSPFEELTLVSCGRENIRFFRMRKGCLPARPVLLNEFARGFTFSDIAFHAEPGPMPLDGRKPCALFASNRGMLLKVDCDQKVVLCAYQLHAGAILALSVHSGYAVTGGADNRLRVWPLDFSDFLLEAQHEAAVSSVCVSQSGRKLSVGTAAGTLGILDVSEHSYNTVLRSHVGAVTFAVARGPAMSEFATIGKDLTIRLWDVVSAQQKFEFNSPTDEPLCAGFHPSQYRLACGFKSGTLRVFDVETTTTITERRKHKAPVTALLFVKASGFPAGCKAPVGAMSSTSPSNIVGGLDPAVVLSERAPSSSHSSGYLLLFTAALDGDVVVYDAERDYTPLKTLSAVTGPCSMVRLTVSADHGLLAVAGSTVASIVVYDTQKLAAVYRGGQLAGSAPPPSTAMMSTSGQPNAFSLTQTAMARSTGTFASSLSSPFGTTAGSSLGGGGVGDGAARGLSESLQQQQSSTAPATGIAFCDDRPGGSLLVTTDRHIVSLPLEAEQASAVGGMGGSMAFGAEENVDAFGRPRKPKTAWELRSVRRLDFGSPVSMMRDASSGLLFLTLKAPEAAPDHRAIAVATSPAGEANSGKKDKGGTTVSSSAAFADSIGIVAARHKANRPDRLSLSAAQLYHDHPGSLQGVCPCTPVGRVVTFDDSGCLVIWRLMRERANMLQASDSPPNAASVAALASASGMLMTLKDAPDTPMGDMHIRPPAVAKLSLGDDDALPGDDDDQQMAATALVEVATAVLAKVTSGKRSMGAPALPRPEKYQNKYERKARTLIKDFEIAVKEDPHVWSAGPCTLEGDNGGDALNAWASVDAALMDVDGTGPKKAFGFSKMRIDRAVAERLDLVLQQEGGSESAAVGEDADGTAIDVADEMAFEEDPENPVSDEEEDDSDDDDDDEEEDEFLPVEEEAVVGLVGFQPLHSYTTHVHDL